MGQKERGRKMRKRKKKKHKRREEKEFAETFCTTYHNYPSENLVVIAEVWPISAVMTRVLFWITFQGFCWSRYFQMRHFRISFQQAQPKHVIEEESGSRVLDCEWNFNEFWWDFSMFAPEHDALYIKDGMIVEKKSYHKKKATKYTNRWVENYDVA